MLNPPVTVLETYHKGSLPQINSFIEIDRKNIIASVLKRAEDSGDLVLRCVETHGVPTEAEIDLKLINRKWRSDFGPFEIKTFRIGGDGTIVATNLLEGEL